jgi:hypothetical protein
MTQALLPLFVSSADLLAGLAGQPIVAVQDAETQLTEHWTPAGLPQGVQCYIGQYQGHYLLYERTSGLKFPTQRVSYPHSYNDHQGFLVLGEPEYLNPDAEGFSTVARLKRFYSEINPAFEAAHPECSTLAGMLEKYLRPEGQAILDKAVGRIVRGKHWFSLSGRD